MNEKLAAFSIFGALAVGYPLGLLISRLVIISRLLARICALVGLVMIFVGSMDAGDIRYLILALAGLYIQVAWLVASFKFKKTNRAQYMELWASQPSRNNSPDPALASVTHPAGQGARHP
jgi:hypothetical protein